MSFSFSEIPPELQDAIKKQYDMHNMNTVDQIHSFNQLLDGMTKDQLVTMRQMVAHVHGECNQGGTSGSHFIGRITELLRIKFDLCPCNTDHDADLRDGIAAESAKEEPGPLPGWEDATGSGNKGEGDWEDKDKHEPAPIDTPVAPSEKEAEQLEQEREWALKAYHVLDVPVQFPKVICATPGCGTTWPNLNDRMESKSGKGGCPQCANREAWG